MKLDRNGLIAAGGLLACLAIVAAHWVEHPRKICAVRFGGRNPTWDGKPGLPCPPARGLWVHQLR
jgi:hypothetical protein